MGLFSRKAYQTLSHLPRFFVVLLILTLVLIVLFEVDNMATQTKTIVGHNLEPTPWHLFPVKTFINKTKYARASKIIQCSYFSCATMTNNGQTIFTRESEQCPDFYRSIHCDLEPWSNTRVSYASLMEAKKFASLRITIIDGKLYVDYYYDCVQSRALFTIWGLLQLLKRYPGSIPDVDLMFDCMDRPTILKRDHSAMPLPIFRYCTTCDHFDIPFPDWSFWGWVEVNLGPWQEEFNSIKLGSQKISWKNKLPYAYWKGNPDVQSPVREKLLFCNDTNIWGAQILRQNWAQEILDGFKNSKLSNQCNHQYKIYAEGYAWSVSLKYILSCGCVPLIIKAKYEDFFSRGLSPGENYLPISPENICQSIKTAVEWGNSHPSEAEAIGKAVQDYMEHLNMDRVYDYMYHLITEYAKLLDFKPVRPSTALEECIGSLLCYADETKREFLERSAASPSSTPPCKLPPANIEMIKKEIEAKNDFLKNLQGQSDEDANAIFEKARHHNLLQHKGLHLLQFLYSDLNHPLSAVVDDMKSPLSHYYIYTSHNTYLTGNQITSDSSVRPIKRALQQGVRGIELDLWPNSTKTDVNVCHGRTLTSSVKLWKCLKVIKDYAFSSSDYPVIITFEDHLNRTLRAKVAIMVKRTFGDMLFQPDKYYDLSKLPSPADLKRKIVISTKPPNESVDTETNAPQKNVLFATISDCFQSKDDSDENSKHQEIEMEGEVPEYRDLIAIHAVKHKGDLLDSLHVDPNKVKRLSLSEQQLLEASKDHGQHIVRFTQGNILRVYPKGSRLDSSNYNPYDGWKLGAQMVAFNMQGFEQNLWLMQGMFRANNGCGYVKKPKFLCEADPAFSPNKVKKILKVTLYMGEGWHLEFHHAHFDYCSPPDFYAKVGIAGYEEDNTPRMYKTKSIEDDWRPVWDKVFEFPIRVPELALLWIEVKDNDTAKKNEFGGQTCLPVLQLRSGIRCVPLYNKKGEKYKFIKLLVRFEFVNPIS
ncbi:hypothetical protein E3N88_44399 [Mikania micrantha]|uniref:Phosphoinositide phospholipase C n=1 Tax=Mikania micrantha TaxID=192012 RepID=A0A5N6LCS6_9ASTR|nr:hypothetical protein E3N88_44399 [Mikania micrantha]